MFYKSLVDLGAATPSPFQPQAWPYKPPREH